MALSSGGVRSTFQLMYCRSLSFCLLGYVTKTRPSKSDDPAGTPRTCDESWNMYMNAVANLCWRVDSSCVSSRVLSRIPDNHGIYYSSRWCRCVTVCGQETMVQQWKRSYLYFISFAKKKGLSCAPRASSIFARARKLYKPLTPRPDWDNTIHDLSVLKLTPKELEARRRAFKTLPEHRVRPSVSSATPSVLCQNDRGEGDANLAEKCTDARGSAASRAISLKRAAATAEEAAADARLQRKHIKNGNGVRRSGKENRTSASVHETHLPVSKREEKTHTGETPKISATGSVKRIPKPLQPAQAARSRRAQSRGCETELGGNQKLSAGPTVDFEEEVKQFEARKKFLVQDAKRLPTASSFAAAAAAASASARSKNRVGAWNFSQKGVMDKKSDSSDDDSSLSGAWGKSITRFQKVVQPVSQQQHHHHHRKHYSRRVQEESAVAATTAGSRQPSRLNQWESQPQNELIYFKQPVDPAIKPRTKLAKRHFGSIQRTPPVGDWKLNYEEGAADHLSLQQEFQRHMLKCQHDLTQEFKAFRISISKQIMNLQLDIDAILELQKRKDSHPAETTAPSSVRTWQESPVPEDVGESVDLPTYSCLKVQQGMMKRASASSGESSQIPLFNVHDGSPYAGTRKSIRSLHGSEVGHRPSSAAAAPEPHVFDNPIYHVQTSSEKDGESSDSDSSISSVELAKFLASRGGHLNLKSESHIIGVDFRIRDEASIADHGGNSPNGLHRSEDEKQTSLVPYGLPQNQQAAEVSGLSESDKLESSYRENRIESNGYAQSNTMGLAGPDDHSLRPRGRLHQKEVSRPATTNGSSPSPSPSHGIGTYRTQSLAVTEQKVSVDDLELRLGNSGVHSAMNSAVNSGRSSPQDCTNGFSPSVSRPLFTTGSWSNLNTSSIMPVSVRDEYHLKDRERTEAANEGPSSRNSKPAENVDERGMFTLRGWSAAFLQQTDNYQKGPSLFDGVPSARTVKPSAEPANGTKTPEAPKQVPCRDVGSGTMKFQGRCAKGGVAWTVSEPPSSAKKKNAPVF